MRREIKIQDLSKQECQCKRKDLNQQHNKRIEENTTPTSNMPDKEQTNCTAVESNDDPLKELHKLAKQRYDQGHKIKFNPNAVTKETLEHAKELNKRMDLLDNILPKEESLKLMVNKYQNYEEVSHPKHYNNYNVEVIDMMERIFGPEETAIFCKLNAFKYRMRMGTKPSASPDTDFRKEQWYLKKAEELKHKINSSYSVSTESHED